MVRSNSWDISVCIGGSNTCNVSGVITGNCVDIVRLDSIKNVIQKKKIEPKGWWKHRPLVFAIFMPSNIERGDIYDERNCSKSFRIAEETGREKDGIKGG